MEFKSKFNPLALVLYSLIFLGFLAMSIAFSFENKSSEKNAVLIFISWFLFLLSAWVIIRNMKRFIISNKKIEVKFILPFLDCNYELSKITTLEVKMRTNSHEAPSKNLTILFNAGKQLKINDFFIENFDEIEKVLQWKLFNKNVSFENMPTDFKIKYTSERIEGELSNLKDHNFLSWMIILLIVFMNVMLLKIEKNNLVYILITFGFISLLLILYLSKKIRGYKKEIARFKSLVQAT